MADAILPLPDEDYWYYLNYVLNELSEQFNEAFLRRDLGVPVRSAVYLIALTREADGGVRSQKIRAMLVRKDLLEKIAAAQEAKAKGGEGQEVAMEVLRENHKTRVKTLNHMATEYKKRPDGSWRSSWGCRTSDVVRGEGAHLRGREFLAKKSWIVSLIRAGAAHS